MATRNVGGTPAVMKFLLEAGMLDGSCMTVTGKTLAENLRDLPGLTPGQPIVRARYGFAEAGEPGLGALVDGFLARARSA